MYALIICLAVGWSPDCQERQMGFYADRTFCLRGLAQARDRRDFRGGYCRRAV